MSFLSSSPVYDWDDGFDPLWYAQGGYNSRFNYDGVYRTRPLYALPPNWEWHNHPGLGWVRAHRHGAHLTLPLVHRERARGGGGRRMRTSHAQVNFDEAACKEESETESDDDEQSESESEDYDVSKSPMSLAEQQLILEAYEKVSSAKQHSTLTCAKTKCAECSLAKATIVAPAAQPASLAAPVFVVAASAATLNSECGFSPTPIGETIAQFLGKHEKFGAFVRVLMKTGAIMLLNNVGKTFTVFVPVGRLAERLEEAVNAEQSGDAAVQMTRGRVISDIALTAKQVMDLARKNAEAEFRDGQKRRFSMGSNKEFVVMIEGLGKFAPDSGIVLQNGIVYPMMDAVAAAAAEEANMETATLKFNFSENPMPVEQARAAVDKFHADVAAAALQSEAAASDALKRAILENQSIQITLGHQFVSDLAGVQANDNVVLDQHVKTLAVKLVGQPQTLESGEQAFYIDAEAAPVSLDGKVDESQRVVVPKLLKIKRGEQNAITPKFVRAQLELLGSDKMAQLHATARQETKAKIETFVLNALK